YIIGEFIDPIVSYRFDYVLLIIFLSFPVIIFFLWFRKNKSKIIPFYKRNKKIFNRIYFYLGSVFSLIPIACIVGIIATGGVSNFIERAKFEINVLFYSYEYDFCQSPSLLYYSGYPTEHVIFFYKEQTQFTDYYPNYFSKYIKVDDLYKFNHCVATRKILKEAQQGDKLAREILVAYTPEMKAMYSFLNEDNKYIFSRYENKIKGMDLDNPALAYSYAVYLDKKIDKYYWEIKDDPFIKPEALKYLKQSAEDGYFIAMDKLINIYSHKFYFNTSKCDKILKYFNTLADEKSLVGYYTLMFGHMGKITSDRAKSVYNCSNQKPNFSKAFSLMKNAPRYEQNLSRNIHSSWPALFYLNGWSDVEQDYDKAYELFENNIMGEWRTVDDGVPSEAYLAYMNFMGMGVEQNPNKGIGLTIELAKKISIDKSPEDFDINQKVQIEIEILCDLNSYNFIIPDLLSLENIYSKNFYKLPKNQQEKQKKEYSASKKINEKIIKEYRNKIGQCIFESEHEVSIKFLEDYIFNRVSDFFKNPELVKTLNYLGETK
ncbi:MAG: hypothetical protein QF864_14865, partial [SAR202 cluster bacterium]|nr:hypothetical protein [SAR202 cluster bacterium]